MPFKFNALTGELDLVNADSLGSLTPTKGNLAVGNGTDWVSLGVGDDDDVLTADAAEAAGIKWAVGGAGGMPSVNVGMAAAQMQVNTTTAIAPLSYRDFGSIEINVRAYDDTGPEYAQGFFRVPGDIDTSGTVTFEVVGSAATAAASRNVNFTFDFVEVADGGLMTGAYGSAETWDDQAIDGTQDSQDIISNTETVTNLAWTVGNVIYWRLYRSAATTNNLTGDYHVIQFNILVPQA